VTVQIADKAVIGRVLDTSWSGVTLEVDGARRDVAWGDLGRGTVEVEFNRPSDALAAGDTGQEG
jgi:ribosome maturation factor RimP